MNFKIKRGKINFNHNAKLYLTAIIFFYICNGAFGMLQGIYLKELNIGEDFLGLVLSGKILAMALFSIPCAIIVNKIGKKWGLFIAMLMVSILTILQGSYANRYFILMFSCIQGIASSFQSVSEGPFFMENTKENNRIKLFSYAFADNVFSTMIGYFVFGSISGKLIKNFGTINSLRYSIIAAGCIGMISCIFIFFIKDTKGSVVITRGKIIDSYKSIFKQKYPRKYLLYNFIIGFGAGLVVPYFNVYLRYKVNASTMQIGVIMALSQASMGIGGLITPYMAKKIGRFKTIILCQLVSIPFLMLIALPPSIIVVAIALFIRNGLMNMTGPVTGNLSMELVKEYERSMFASVNNISSSLSRAFSSVLAGFIMKNFVNGYEIPYFITSIMYLLGTYYFFISFKNYSKDMKIARV